MTLEGKDEHGEDVRFELEGYGARVVQHELDHLDGVLIIDRTDDEHRKEALSACCGRASSSLRVRIGVAATAPIGADVLERLAAHARDRLPAHAPRRAARPRPQARAAAGEGGADRLGIPVHQPEKPELPASRRRRASSSARTGSTSRRACSSGRSG